MMTRDEKGRKEEVKKKEFAQRKGTVKEHSGTRGSN